MHAQTKPHKNEREETMKAALCMMVLAFAAQAFAATSVGVADVNVQQRYLRSGLVDIAMMLQDQVEDVADVEGTFSASNSADRAAIQVEHIMRNGDDVVSSDVMARKFIWDAGSDLLDDIKTSKLKVKTYFVEGEE